MIEHPLKRPLGPQVVSRRRVANAFGLPCAAGGVQDEQACFCCPMEQLATYPVACQRHRATTRRGLRSSARLPVQHDAAQAILDGRRFGQSLVDRRLQWQDFAAAVQPRRM